MEWDTLHLPKKKKKLSVGGSVNNTMEPPEVVRLSFNEIRVLYFSFDLQIFAMFVLQIVKQSRHTHWTWCKLMTPFFFFFFLSVFQHNTYILLCWLKLLRLKLYMIWYCMHHFYFYSNVAYASVCPCPQEIILLSVSSNSYWSTFWRVQLLQLKEIV